MKPQRNILAALMAFSILFAACGQGVQPTEEPTPIAEATSPAAPAPTAEEEAQPEVVSIGVLYALTGVASADSVPSFCALTLAADIVNGEYPDVDLPLAATAGLPNLGGAQLHLITADTQMNDEKAMTDAERLITYDEVSALIGGWSSAQAMVIAPVAERYHVPYLADVPSMASLTEQGWEYFFRTGPTDAVFGRNYLRFLADVRDVRGFDIQTIAVLAEDNLYGQGLADMLVSLSGEYGLTVVETLYHPVGATDMTPEVLRLMEVDPDVVLILSGRAPDVVLANQTMRRLGWMPQAVLGHGGMVGPSIIPTLGADVEGWLGRELFSMDMSFAHPLVQQINDLFRERCGRGTTDMNGNDAKAFMGMYVLADAINRAGSADPEAIRQALLETSIPSEHSLLPGVGVRFDPVTHQNSEVSGIMVQAIDGAWRLVWPFDDAPVELIWPVPAWR